MIREEDRMRDIFIAGNWKMNLSCEAAMQYARDFWPPEEKGLITAVAVPFTMLESLEEGLEGSSLLVFAQNMHYEDSGAFTGEISASMLKELGTDGVILGHSERRQYFGETDEAVLLKAKKAVSSGLIPIVCVGETLEERDAGRHFEKVESQIRSLFTGLDPEEAEKVTVAYEPIWAIGTGRTASSDQAQEMCAFIRKTVRDIHPGAADKVLIQYGGSVKASNIADIMSQPDIDGALVGGASLDPEGFADIVRRAAEAKGLRIKGRNGR